MPVDSCSHDQWVLRGWFRWMLCVGIGLKAVLEANKKIFVINIVGLFLRVLNLSEVKNSL